MVRSSSIPVPRSIWQSPHSHMSRPERHNTGTGAKTRGSVVWPRAVFRTRYMRAARTLRSSCASACGVGTCIGTCIGKRNGEERARPACKGRLVGGAYSGSRKIRQRWRGPSDDPPHVRRQAQRARRPLCVCPSSTGATGGGVESVARAPSPHTARVGVKKVKVRVADLQVTP
jgi:hypothetical protein